jgi:hypothetical protein
MHPGVRTSRRQFLVNSAGVAVALSFPISAWSEQAEPSSQIGAPNNGNTFMNTITTKDGTQIYYN